jgi:hypothetical protein
VLPSLRTSESREKISHPETYFYIYLFSWVHLECHHPKTSASKFSALYMISTSALVTALLHCVRGCTRDVYMSVFEEEIKIDFPSLSPRCALIACSSSRLRMYTRPPLNSRNKLYPVYLSSIQFTQQMLGTKSSSTVLDTSILPLPDTSIIMSFVEIAWHPRAN